MIYKKVIICGVMMMFTKFIKKVEKLSESVVVQNDPTFPIKEKLTDNLVFIRERFGNSFDLIFRRSDVSGKEIAFVFIDGMCDSNKMMIALVKPVMEMKETPKKKDSLYEYIRDYVCATPDQSECVNLNDCIGKLISGFMILFVDGETRALSVGAQGFAKRGVSDPMTDVQERGSYEGFTDNFKDNMTLIRRRLRTPDLHFDINEIGETSRTYVVLCYLGDRVSPDILAKVQQRLEKAVLDVVLGPDYLRAYLDSESATLFTSIGTTERPDSFCAKLAEGKVGIIVDGTPHALYLPKTFSEEFQTLDDYMGRAYYATFLRLLKILGFLVGIYLPGVYAAIGTFHQELLPVDMLYNITVTATTTPFPIFIEAILIHVIYEVVREAGIRMPKMVGHAVSIVGGLVIGQAAVAAGLITGPMLIIVALTAICSAVVSSMYEVVAILRFIYLVAGGLFGLYGIMLVTCMMLMQICQTNPYGVAYSSPISPLSIGAIRDSLLRFSWKSLGKRRFYVDRLSNVGTDEEGNI